MARQGKRTQVGSISYAKAAVIMGLVNVVLLGVTKQAYALSSTLTAWGAILLPFQDNLVLFPNISVPATAKELLFYPGTFLLLGTLLGATLAAGTHGGLRWRAVKSIRRTIVVFAGGILMGYGARLAGGCNVGAFWDGIASSSLHGWVFGLAMFLGVALVVKVIQLFY